MRENARLVQTAYDRIAEGYDELWSIHLREPHARLTRELSLARGERCADLGCGTGLETLEMVRAVAPGEVVGVDCSQSMLDTAKRRMKQAGYDLAISCQDVESFIRHAEGPRFDVITLRLCLAYFDWRTLLPLLPRHLRPSGRIGILTNLTTSAPQAYQTYQRMVDDLGLPNVPLTVPESAEQVEQTLTDGGAIIEHSWHHHFRLWFATGADMARWLPNSGFVTHPRLVAQPDSLLAMLWAAFAERVEALREDQGIPLDFDLAGIVARLPDPA